MILLLLVILFVVVMVVEGVRVCFWVRAAQDAKDVQDRHLEEVVCPAC